MTVIPEWMHGKNPASGIRSMDVYGLAIIVSLLVYLVVGNLAGRNVKDLDDYFVAGRRAPSLLIIGTLVASVISTNSFLADTGVTYSGFALSQIFWAPIAVMGYIFGGLYFGRYLRRSRALTVAEFFGRRFNSRRVRMVAGLTVIAGLGGYLLGVTQGTSLILSEVTGLPFQTTLVIMWASYTAFTFYAGSRGVVITDTMMFILFATMAFVAMGFIIDASGGWYATIEGLATFQDRPGIIGVEGFTRPGGMWETPTDMWVWVVIFGLAWGLVFAISPWQSSRYLMAKNEHVVMRSACAATCILALLWPVIYFSGAAIALSNAHIQPEERAMIWAAMNLMPPLVGATLLAGIMSAGLSSASTFLSLVGFAISNDVVQSSESSESKRLRLSRITIVAVGLVVLIVALFVPVNLFWIIQFAGPMFASCWGPIAFLSVWSRSVTEAGAFWGMVSGLVFCVGPRALEVLEIYNFPTWLDPILIGALVSLFTILVVSKLTHVSDAEIKARQELHKTPSELGDKEQLRLTLFWPRVMILVGVAGSMALLIFYVHPYQKATGMLAENGSYLVWSGELGLSLSFGALLMGGGLFAYHSIRRFCAIEQ